MAISEKEKIIVFIKDSLTFMLLWLIYFSLLIESLSTLFIIYLIYFLLLLLLVYNFEEKSYNVKKIRFSFKSIVFKYSFITTLLFIFNYSFHNIFSIRMKLENGIYFIILDFIMIFWYFIVFNWRR
ncbi:MAG: hypothetical protein CVU03_13755 [Bacteroidetes bacterium HGW-Bacteroidetes-2]|jgi:hypothetical protein|nr:MAG: hypothetical protein CVU03_13755 [Bacteroidetes bacterium HGW-Bacteroidetes-2]